MSIVDHHRVIPLFINQEKEKVQKRRTSWKCSDNWTTHLSHKEEECIPGDCADIQVTDYAVFLQNIADSNEDRVDAWWTSQRKSVIPGDLFVFQINRTGYTTFLRLDTRYLSHVRLFSSRTNLIIAKAKCRTRWGIVSHPTSTKIPPSLSELYVSNSASALN